MAAVGWSFSWLCQKVKDSMYSSRRPSRQYYVILILQWRNPYKDDTLCSFLSDKRLTLKYGCCWKLLLFINSIRKL